jgi:DNA replication licensing factor MCM5
MFQKSKNSQGAPALRTAYLRVCHLELSTGESVSTGGLGGQRWTAQEEEEFAEMARYRDDKGGIYERFARSVAPSIYGNEGWMPSPQPATSQTYICLPS